MCLRERITIKYWSANSYRLRVADKTHKSIEYRTLVVQAPVVKRLDKSLFGGQRSRFCNHLSAEEPFIRWITSSDFYTTKA